MLSPSERMSYLGSEMDAELGPTFMAAVQQLLRLYADRVNEELTEPVIQQVMRSEIMKGKLILKYQILRG